MPELNNTRGSAIELAYLSPLFPKNVKVRSVSNPSHILEFFERILCKQINNSITYISPLLCSFRKNHNSQCSIKKMMKIWKKYFYKKKQIVVILVCISENVDTINRSLLPTKFETSGVTVNIHSPKKTLPSTYLLANKYSPVFFPRIKRLLGVFIYQ